MHTWRIGLTCINRPYLKRTLQSLMAGGLRGFTQDHTIELFDGSGDPGYMHAHKKTWPQLIIHSDGWKRNNVKNNLWKWGILRVNTEWVMHLSDDVIVCRDYMRYAHLFVQKFRQHFDVFSFWTPYREVCHAWKNKRPYWRFPADKFYGGIALALKSHVLEQLLASGLWKGQVGFDMVMHKFFRARKITVCAAVPNLTQHIGRHTTQKHGQGERLAPCFIGEEKSPFGLWRI